jgi:alkyldihydroxyacetonephosphate synthase
MIQPRLKHFGWGREGEGLTSAEETFVFERIEQRFGPLADSEVRPPRLEELKLESPRLSPLASLPFCSTALYDRAAHTYGKSFPDYARGLVGDYSSAPDVVAYPARQAPVLRQGALGQSERGMRLLSHAPDAIRQTAPTITL